MNAVPLAGSQLTAALSDFFSESVDILEDTGASRDSFGHQTADWDVVAGLSGLAAAVGSDSVSVNQLQQGGMAVRSVTGLKFKLASYHPEITTANRLRWSGQDYRIVATFPDMTATLTHLSCELVVPGV